MEKNKLASLRRAGQVAKLAHRQAKQLIRPGVNIQEIEAGVTRVINENGLRPAFRGYKGYPAATCISVNEEIVHGIPTDRVLKQGDIVSVDLGVECDGYLVDTARTHPVGPVSAQLQKLLFVTEQALRLAVKQARPGNTTGDIGEIVERTVKQAGFSVVRDLTGHGVGKTLQEPPSIPNFGSSGSGSKLKEGMVLAIEPITTTTPSDIAVKADGWTIVAINGAKSAHFEDTVLVGKDGPVVLT